MTALGADYSEARPGGANLKKAGVTSVGRYLANQGDDRAIEKTEYDDLKANGIGVWFVREGYANGILGGRSQGETDAHTAIGNLNRLGLGLQLVYAACDFDIQTSQYPAADDYMRGFASVLGASHVGIYGGMAYLNHCRTSNLASRFWKSAATSWDHGQTGAMDIEQTTQTPPVPGSDHDIIHTADHGQPTAPTKGQKVIPYHHEDRTANSLAPGGQTFLHSAKTNADVNVVGGVGPYSITAHVYADGLEPSDVIDIALVWENTANKPPSSKPSAHYTERLVADAQGIIRGNVTFQRGVASGDMVFVRVQAPKTNRQTARITLIDSDAYLYV